MKRKRSSDEQVAFAPRQADGGTAGRRDGGTAAPPRS
jgi:hypothetical protein